MMMNKTTHIKPWGNSNGILINKEILNSLGLSTNDEVELSIEDQKLVITPKRRLTLKERFANYEGGPEGYVYSDEVKAWANKERVGRELH